MKTIADIRMNLKLSETRVSGKHLCRWRYGSPFIRFHTVVVESEVEKSSQTDDENRF